MKCRPPCLAGMCTDGYGRRRGKTNVNSHVSHKLPFISFYECTVPLDTTLKLHLDNCELFLVEKLSGMKRK